MASAGYDTKGRDVEISFPPWGQIGPATKELLELHGFQKTGVELDNTYRKPFKNAEEHTQLTQAARHIADLYKTGRKEYCRELLIAKPRIKHG